MTTKNDSAPLEELLKLVQADVRDSINAVNQGTPDTKATKKAKRQSCSRILDGADPEVEIAALGTRVDELLVQVRSNPVGLNHAGRPRPKRQARRRISEVRAAYQGLNGAATRRLLDRLRQAGPLGIIAATLFTAQKANQRAGSYRGGVDRTDGDFDSFADLSYDRKHEAIQELCDQLMIDACGFNWGWKDGEGTYLPFVFYIDLPQGQICFQCEEQYEGPDYSGEWDKTRHNERRVLEFCEEVLAFVTDAHDEQ